MLSVQQLSKRYKQGRRDVLVLNNVNFEIEEGAFVTIMGPSGSGKSTLLNILGMLDEPSEGEYLFHGQPVHTLGERERTRLHREHIGFVFQQFHLLEDLTVYENLETPLLYQKVSRSERKGRIASMLDRFGIVATKDLFPSQLSGGQQQMVAVARALIIQPSLILADEPTGSLHSSQGRVIMETLKELNERDGVTILQVTHDEAVASFGERIIDLVDGRVAADRTTRKRPSAATHAEEDRCERLP